MPILRFTSHGIWSWILNVGLSGSAFGVIAALATWLRRSEKIDRQSTTTPTLNDAWNIQRILSGDWWGTFIEHPSTEIAAVVYDVSWRLGENKGVYSGKAYARYEHGDNNARQVYEMTGSPESMRFLRLSYRNCNLADNNFGHTILQLNDEGTELTGSFVAYSSFRKRVITGNVVMRRGHK